MQSPQSKDERVVAIGGLPSDQATDALRGEQQTWDAESLPSAVPDFKRVAHYSFIAEWAVVGDDIQVKFFVPAHARVNTPEARKAWMEYWFKRFPLVIDPTAREYFEADHPRLVVKWTDEFVEPGQVPSWWFRARGFAHMIDVSAFVLGFLMKFDQALRVSSAGS
jgi:hypothetical protein